MKQAMVRLAEYGCARYVQGALIGVGARVAWNLRVT